MKIKIVLVFLYKNYLAGETLVATKVFCSRLYKYNRFTFNFVAPLPKKSLLCKSFLGALFLLFKRETSSKNAPCKA